MAIMTTGVLPAVIQHFGPLPLSSAALVRLKLCSIYQPYNHRVIPPGARRAYSTRNIPFGPSVPAQRGRILTLNNRTQREPHIAHGHRCP